ncbi:MAG: polyphosphate kinase 1 [Planctomycetota bacterium]
MAPANPAQPFPAPAGPPSAAPAPALDLARPELYVNRELSALEFDRRVLEQAKDPGVPLLERMRFLSICSTNLDEFFEIRVSGLRQQIAFGIAQPGPDGLSPRDNLREISAVAHRLVEEQYRVLNELLQPQLTAEGIRILKRAEWTPAQERWMRRYFKAEVLPVLTPIGLDPAHPFPKLLNKSLNFLVTVEGRDAFARESGIAIVQVPRSLPRVIALPDDVRGAPYDFVLLSSIIHAYIGVLFPGMEVTGCYQFRVTRNSELWVDEEEVENLLQALKGELFSRNYGEAVRLEVADTCPQEHGQFLLQKAQLQPEDLYPVNGPVNLHRLVAIYDLVDRPDLKYRPFLPSVPRRFQQAENVFAAMRRGDVLLHHPFESFGPVVDLIRQAAADPDVAAIKQTLYRTGADTPLVDVLVEAARAGKEVTVLVELRARFDEAANIKLATILQEAGVTVVYGIVGYKAHAKMLLIVRREGRKLRRYVHLGTGNYHTRTVRAYTDISLLTCDPEIGEDVHKIFLQLTGLGRAYRLKKMLQSPFTMHNTLLAHIEDEIAAARAGRPAKILAKMNSLTEPQLIQALYRASQAGVQVDLVVRGICCLRPGVPGVSENIRVRSIVGRFLEHSRIVRFHAGGKELVYCGSADWMQRNFFRRVETCFPVEDERLKTRLIVEGLETYLEDNTRAWLLQPDGTYRRAAPDGAERVSAQESLLATLSGEG